jgi:hypothetical protein
MRHASRARTKDLIQPVSCCAKMRCRQKSRDRVWNARIPFPPRGSAPRRKWRRRFRLRATARSGWPSSSPWMRATTSAPLSSSRSCGERARRRTESSRGIAAGPPRLVTLDRTVSRWYCNGAHASASAASRPTVGSLSSRVCARESPVRPVGRQIAEAARAHAEVEALERTEGGALHPHERGLREPSGDREASSATFAQRMCAASSTRRWRTG